MNPFIFCISVNTAKITAVMLKSFHRHHNEKIHIIGSNEDIAELSQSVSHENNVFISISNNDELLNDFKTGHRGTTKIFSMVIQKMFGGEYDSFIHIDADVYFKKESISTITYSFVEGYDIVGTRRCFKNNPSGVKGLDDFPDTISTFFFGMKLDKIPNYSFADLCKYCEGAGHPNAGWIALDCFDGVTHGAMNNGGRIKYLDWNEFGSQDENGKKNNNFPTNMHMDCGSNIIHMGGVGSGYSYYLQKSKPQEGYARWSLGRYSLFAKLFYNEEIGHTEETVYGSDGRWINGNYDENIMNGLKKDLQIYDK